MPDEPQEPRYVCDRCGLPIEGDDPHTNDETGGDVHEACCLTCNPTPESIAQAFHDAINWDVVDSLTDEEITRAERAQEDAREEEHAERSRRLRDVYSQPRNREER